ncbi:DegT/DnrJ/EryC1/StrS family aminotransferase [Amycolatopsis lurida]
MPFTYPISKPSLGGNELAYVTEAVTGNWISSQGPNVVKFESAFAEYNGMARGVSCSSGTTALTVALRALGVGPGDEVLVPEFTYVASAWSVTYLGATPVFVDCGDDLTVDVARLEAKITARTKVIMPVHVYGRQCDMTTIMRLAHEYGLRVVEDTAEAHGVRPVGDIACFSLFANKIITAGEGGICLTDDPWLAVQMAHLRGLGASSEHSYLHRKVAYNFRFTNLQASVALAQVERLDEILALRAAIEKRYQTGLEGIDGLTPMPPRDVLWMFDVLAEDRDGLREYLAGEGIDTRPFFIPMSRQPMYFDPDWASLKAAGFSAKGLYLPTYTDLSESDQDYIIGRIRRFYGAN